MRTSTAVKPAPKRTEQAIVYVRMRDAVVGDHVTPLRGGDEHRERFSYGRDAIVGLPANEAADLIRAGLAEETVELRPVCKRVGVSQVAHFLISQEWEVAGE